MDTLPLGEWNSGLNSELGLLSLQDHIGAEVAGLTINLLTK